MQNSYLGEVLIVGLGGFIGSGARYALAGLVQRLASAGTFPYGTLVVNVLGCLVIGFLAGLIDVGQEVGPRLRLFLMIGVLGGFTTFSTFAYETLALSRSAEFLRASVYVLAHIIVGLFAAWLGHLSARSL